MTEAREKAKFTPGPWNTNFTTVGGEAHDWHITAPEHGSINPICERGRGDIRSDAEERANACLMAASPDLYDVPRAIKLFGHLANIPVSGGYPPSPRPESKDVWCFPRHLVADIDAALARADGAGQ